MANKRNTGLGHETVIVEASGLMLIPAALLAALGWKPAAGGLAVTTDLDVLGCIFLQPSDAINPRLQEKFGELEEKGYMPELLALMDRYRGAVVSPAGEITLDPALLSFLKIPPRTVTYLHLVAREGRLELKNEKRRWEALQENSVELEEEA